MSKDAKDKFTVDLVQPGAGVVRQRGRPVTNPLDKKEQAAARQKARRERLKAAGVESITITLPVDVIEALRKFVEFKDMTQADAVEKILRDRLLRKR